MCSRNVVRGFFIHDLPQGVGARRPHGRAGGGRQPAGTAAAHDALVICLLLLDQEPDRYERAALKWLGRLLLEQRGMGLRHAELAAAYLAAWPDPARRDAATEALGELGRAVGLRRLGPRIARAGGG